MTVRRESEGHNPPPESRPWAALPQDILRLIAERLYLVDRIRFRAVCKEWLVAPIHDLQPIHKFPWIMDYVFTSATTICSLYEPSRTEPYLIINGMNADEREKTRRTMLSHASVCASRHGWLLFSKWIDHLTKEIEGIEYTLGITSYFLYNLLTQEVLTLPNLEWTQYGTDNLAAFSSDPTSPDCVFFVPHHFIRNNDHIFISTYSIGDETWKTLSFTCPNVFSYYAQISVVYMEGSFYCFSVQGFLASLASFNIATREWRPLASVVWRPSLMLDRAPVRSHLLEYGGHLIIVWIKMHPEFSRRECEIFRFDWLDRAWVKMESLEGGAIFLESSSFGVSAGERTKMVANRVYYFSTNTARFITYGPASSGIQSEPQDTDTTVYPADLSRGCKTWIEAPLLKPWRG